MDFVGVLRELRKALQFDSSDVSGVIEDLGLLMHDFHNKIAEAKARYLDNADGGGVAETRAGYATAGGSADERLEQVVYTRFLDTDARKGFFSTYKEIEALWEILSPSASYGTTSTLSGVSPISTPSSATPMPTVLTLWQIWRTRPSASLKSRLRYTAWAT